MLLSGMAGLMKKNEIKLIKVERPWSHFFKDPVFGRVWWDKDENDNRVYTRGVLYLHPKQPEWLTVVAGIHDQGHLDGLPGQSWPLDVMFEAPGKLADTIWEKLLMIVVGPVVLIRRLFTGSWFCKVNRVKLEKVKA